MTKKVDTQSKARTRVSQSKRTRDEQASSSNSAQTQRSRPAEPQFQRAQSKPRQKPTQSRPSIVNFLTRKSILIPVAILVLILTSSLIYYKPLKIWYREVRQERVLREQLIAIHDYNEALRNEIKSLDTTAGIEDYATSQLNLIHKGDNVVIVTSDGEPLSKTSDSRAQKIEDLSKTSKPFGAWTNFLDKLFALR